MAVLLDLPQELLVRVASYLTTAELGPFRRSCKQVEKGLFKAFAKEFFTKRQFMIEHVSLQALVDIANHKTLAPYLKEVIIGTQKLYYDSDFLSDRGRRYREAGYMEHSLFEATGQAQAMLVEAFTKLPNLQIVGLRDYDGAGRVRDGEVARWKSYGWSFDGPRPAWADPPRPKMPNPIFGSMMLALGKAQSRVEGVEVFLRRPTQLTPAAFHIVHGPIGAAVNPVLGGLKRLMLAIRINGNSVTDGETFGAPWKPYTEAGDNTTKSLKLFLRETPNLETLRLNFNPSQFYGHRFLEWLGRSVSTITDPLLVPSVDLASLACLDLGLVTVFPKTLVSVISKFKTLKSVNLWKICLSSGDKTPPSDENCMAVFLSELREALSSKCGIKHMLIGYPSHALPTFVHLQTGVYASPVYFAADGNSDNSALSNRTEQIKYRAHFGSDIKVWLKAVSASVIVLEPPTVLEVSESDEEGSEEEIDVIEIDGEDETEDDSDD